MAPVGGPLLFEGDGVEVEPAGVEVLEVSTGKDVFVTIR